MTLPVTLRRVLETLLLVAFGVFASGCVAPSGTSAMDQRQEILQQHDAILREFAGVQPYGQKQLDAAAGYATMTNIQNQVLLVGGGNGYGVAVHVADDEKTFIKYTEIDGGPGIGVASYRTLLIFRDEYAFANFVSGQWLYQAEADATAKVDQAGVGVQATGELNQPVTIYQMSGSGLQAKASLGGVRFRPNAALKR